MTPGPPLEPVDIATGRRQSYLDSVHPDDVDSLDALLDAAEVPDAHAIVRISIAGQWHLVEHRVDCQLADGGVRLERFDVEHRERQRERAGRTETYWRTILRNGHESIAVIDPDNFTIRHASHGLADVLRTTTSALEGSDVRPYIAEEYHDALAATLDELKPHQVATVEVELLRDDRTHIWVEATLSDARDLPDVAAFVVNLRDITDRKAAEQALADSEHLFRVLVRHLADGAVVVAADLTIAYVSESAASVVGVPAPDLVGERLPLFARSDGSLALGPFNNLTEVGLDALPAEVRAAGDRWFEVSRHDLHSDPVVAGWVLVLRDVTDRRRRVERLRWEVERDSLTGLLNRRGFERQLAEHLDRGQLIGIGFLDLDGFKAVNDEYGHARGDELLVQVASRLRSIVRPSDIVARFGGDEFVIACIDVPTDNEMIELTERIHRATSGSYQLDDIMVEVGVSAGWSLAHPDRGVADALQRADERMYLHKRTHRVGAAYADPR